MDVSDLRREYLRGRLEIDDLKPDPMQQFERWFKDARDAGVPEPNAMGLDQLPGLSVA